MDKNRRESIMNAINSFEQKNKPKKVLPKKKKKNTSPESDFVKSFLKFVKTLDGYFEIHTIEAKAVWNVEAGRYVNGQAESSFPDMVGNDKYGNVLYIEAKAPGKRSTLSLGQYEFLKRKIEMNCFAVCIDSVDLFKELYKKWLKGSGDSRKQLLINELPLSKKNKAILNDDEPLF
jgi:hypothetical protein